MKKKRLFGMLLPVLALVAGLQGCYYEEQFRHGEVYLALEPAPEQYVKYYWDSNPSMPYYYEWGYFYHTQPGTFDYEYALADGWVYYGTYQLERDLGSSGGPGYAAYDGQDRYYSFYCYSGGGFSDYIYLRQAGEEAIRAEALSDTTIDFDGYKMHLTRNRVPADSFRSAKDPKFERKP